MDSSILRSRLSNSFSELQFLSTQELDECKWPVIQRVFSLLFEKSASLRQYSEQIFDLTDLRNQELQRRRSDPKNREKWNDSNANFKTCFLRIIIDGLSLLRWPPSLVAFSDPLEAVLSNPRDAMAYLLEFGILSETNRHTRVKKVEVARDVLKSPQQERYEKNLQSHNEHQHEYQRQPSSPSEHKALNHSLKDEKCSQYDSFYSDENSEVQALESSHYSEGGHDRELTLGKEDSINMKKRTAKNNEDIHASFADLKKLRQSFEILQYQNESLSRQLKNLQDSINIRDGVENSIGAILSDFKATIDEIVNIPKSNKNDSKEGSIPYVIPQLSKNPILTKTLDEEFKEEIEREKQRENNSNSFQNKNSIPIQNRINSQSRSLNVSSVSSVPLGGSAIIFIKLQTKLKKLEKEWMDARKKVLNCFLDTINCHNKCNYYSNSDKESNKNRNKSKEIGKGKLIRNLVNSTIESSFNNDRGWDGDGRPKSGSREKERISVVENNLSLSCKIRTHQILGVKAPLTLGSLDDPNDSPISLHGLNLQRIHILQRDLISFSETAFTFFSNHENLEMNDNKNIKDRNRKEITTNQQRFSPDPFPTNLEDAEKQILFFELYQQSQELLLHLSCLAPLSPLITTGSYSSSCTGLELIQNEINILYPHQPTGSGQRAQAAVRLQGIIDRIKSEQINLIRSLQCSNSMLHQWSSAAARTIPLFSTFGKNASESSLNARQDVISLCGCLTHIVQAMNLAEESKIIPPKGHYPLTTRAKSRSDFGTGTGTGSESRSGSGILGTGGILEGTGRPTSARSVLGQEPFSPSISINGITTQLGTMNASPSVSGLMTQSMGGISLQPTMISPLESLSRGCMGEETAALINTLRIYIDDLKLIPRALENMKSQLLKENNKGLKVFENAKKNVFNASVMTETTLREIESSWYNSKN